MKRRERLNQCRLPLQTPPGCSSSDAGEPPTTSNSRRQVHERPQALVLFMVLSSHPVALFGRAKFRECQTETQDVWQCFLHCSPFFQYVLQHLEKKSFFFFSSLFTKSRERMISGLLQSKPLWDRWFESSGVSFKVICIRL